MSTTDAALGDVDFELHRRRFENATGGGLALGACDPRGTPIWPGADPGSLFTRTLAQLEGSGFVWDCNGHAFRHRVLDNGHAMVHAPISPPPAAPLGYLVAVGQASKLDASAAGFASTMRALEDTAAAIRAEQKLRRELDSLALELAARYDELHLVYSIDSHIRNFSGGWQVFQKLVELCAQHMNADVAALVYPTLDVTLSATNLSKPMFNLDLVLVELRGDLYRFIQAGKQSVAINEAGDERRGYIFTGMPYKLLASPLYLGNSVAAILALVNHDDKPDFSASDRKLVEVMANQFSNLLHMYRMLEEQRTFNRQIVAALIEAVEAKEPYTRGHSERVSAISVDIGRELDLPEAAIDALGWASVLHDVGKIGIPDAVLSKPGALTRDEYTFIKVHSERGCEILKHIEHLKPVLPAVRHHHERFEGGGYPDGIAGKSIPLSARIIAVADTYDAMTSSRAYRAGRSHEEALLEIRRVSGTQLDPEAVAAFLRVCGRDPAWIRTFGILRTQGDD